MHFFYYSQKKLSYSYLPHSKQRKGFFYGFLQFVIKELGGPPSPRGGGGRRVLPDGIYNMTFYRVRFSSMQLSLGLGIEIREQLLYREGFGEFSLV